MPPNRFLAGSAHVMWKGWRKVNSAGRPMLLMPGHPRADVKGYVLEHLAVAERALGRPIPDVVVVHHVNEVKSDNRNANLAIFPDQGYHQALHGRLRTLRAGGNPWTQRLCGPCATVKDLSAFRRSSSGVVAGVCIACRNAACRARNARRRADYHPHAKLTAEQVQAIRVELAAGGPRGFQAAIAQRYGVGRSVICRIGKGETWRAA